MNKHLPLTLCLLLLFVTSGLKSEKNNKVDSLENLLKSHEIDDTSKVNLLNEIAFEVYLTNKDKALKYATYSGELAEKLNYKKGIAESLWLMGLGTGKSNSNLAIDYVVRAVKIAEAEGNKSSAAKFLSTLALLYKSIGDSDKALDCFLKSVQLSEEINDQLNTAKTLHKLGQFYNGEGIYDKSITTYLKGLKIAEKLDEKGIEFGCLNGLGMIHAYQGKYPQALDYFQRCLRIKEISNDRAGTFSGINNIGNIYMLLSDYPKAFDYYGKALQLANESKDKKKIAICYGNIGSVYKKKNDLRSLDYFQKALEISQEIGDYQTTISVYIYLGDVYVQQSKLALAMDYYQKALQQSVERDWKRPLSEIYNKIGTIYLAQKKYDIALSSTLKALDIANEMDLMDSKNDIHKQLSKIYAATNNFSKAYFHQKRFGEINDSVYNDRNVKKIAELEYTYKFEKKKQAIEAMQQKKDAVQSAITKSLIGGIVLLLLFAGYVYRSLQAKHRSNLLLIRQKIEIEKLNDEYLALNKEYIKLNEQLKESNIQINNELDLNQKSMTAATLKLIQNAGRDAMTIDRLQQIEQHTSNEGKQNIKALIADYTRSSYNSNWDEFEILFEKVHNSFYESLNTNYPTLTTNERKLCAFLKLNMTNKDIAHITYQSEEALKKSRLRLRQKLQIDRETNLSTFIQSI
jgi:tetratricopeptide (TPR) repeat protein